MVKNRIEYIDAIKGFAILLVVMGHVLPWSFRDVDQAIALESPMLLWKIIYSFHMPLFIFISGYLFGMSKMCNVKNYLEKLLKKAQQLLIPYFVCGILVLLWRGGKPLTYWYLLTLFQLILIFGGISLVADKMKKSMNKAIFEITIWVALYFVLLMIAKMFKSPFLDAFAWYHHLVAFYPYFTIGYFISRYFSVEKLMNNHVFSISLIVYCLSLIYDIPSLLNVKIQSLTGVYCVFYLFVCCFTEGKIINYFKKIGKKTLHIYVLHLFFAIEIVQLGDYFIWLAQSSRMGFVTCFVLQLLFSLIVSVVIIQMCLFMARLTKTSKILSFTLFGETLKNGK